MENETTMLMELDPYAGLTPLECAAVAEVAAEEAYALIESGQYEHFSVTELAAAEVRRIAADPEALDDAVVEYVCDHAYLGLTPYEQLAVKTAAQKAAHEMVMNAPALLGERSLGQLIKFEAYRINRDAQAREDAMASYDGRYVMITAIGSPRK